MTTLGQNNDQFGTLFTIAFVASVAGVIASAVTLDVTRLTHPVMFAIGLVAIAANADSFSTNLTRAPELYATQAVIAFSTTFFLGPSLLFGMTRALQQGPGTSSASSRCSGCSIRWAAWAAPRCSAPIR